MRACMSRSSWSLQLRSVSFVILSVVFLTSTALAEDKQPEAAAASASPLYEVKDGNQVDAATLQGWKTWRALACERCHGAAQEGMVGPSLIDSMKRLSKAEFHDTVLKGRPEKGMPPFNTSEMVSKNWEGLYAYLKGRSDGAIQPGRLTAIEQK
jgi:mono/diheme cytochrome c family protein